MSITEPEPRSVFELDEAEEARLDAEAEAAIEAGDFVKHDCVVEWLQSWGTATELPCPKPESR